ncbi:MAG: tetratricopeptide repeat protein [Candidatus Brocadiia bacterium]
MAQRLASGGSDARRLLLLAAAIAAIAFAVYIPALRGGFAWDDSVQVTDNPLIKDPHGLRRLWFGTEAMDYFPLTLATHWLEWRLWGLRAAGYHAFNVLLHAISAVLIWRVLRQLKVPGVWLAGALFAVHPVAADSVAWISERKNTLSMALYLASLLAWLRFDDGGSHHDDTTSTTDGISHSALRTPQYLLSLVLFLLALLAKTSVVILPFVLLLCAWRRRGCISRRDIVRSVPYFALAAALGLVTLWFQRHNAIHGMTVRSEGAASRLAASGWIAWFYLYKLLLPAGLCAIYPRWKVDGASVAAYLPLALLAAGLIWLWIRRKSSDRAPLFAAAYFLLALLPVLGIVNMLFMGLSLVADHFQYLAMIGVIAFAAAVLARAASARGWAGRAGVAASVGCVAVLGVLTWNRAGLYGDEERLWQDNLTKNPSAVVYNALGVARSYAGRPEQALESFDAAIRLKPELAEAFVNRAAALDALGRMQEAVRDYDQALKLRPQDAATYNGRGNALTRMNRADDALKDYDTAIALRPRYGLAYYNRGNIRFNAGRLDLALADYDQAINLMPEYARAWNNRATVLAQLGRGDDALRDFSQALALDPTNAGAWRNRALLYAERKEYAKALADVRMFEKLGGHPDPDFVKRLNQAVGEPP